MKKCPNCESIMNEVIKVDVLIDVCPKCMGIWLDKGELDKIIARSNSYKEDYEYDNHGEHHNRHDEHDDCDDHRDYDHFNKGKGGGRRRLGNIFGDLFD